MHDVWRVQRVYARTKRLKRKLFGFRSLARSLSFSFYPSIIIRMGMTVDIGRHNVYTETEFGRAKRKENTF